MRDAGSIPGSGRSPGGGLGHPLQHSCLENPVDRGAWRATVCGAADSHTRLKPPSRQARMLHTAEPPGPHPLRPPCPLFPVMRASWELRECSGVPLPQERPVSSCPWSLPLAGPSPPSSPLTSHLREAHRDGPVSHHTCLPAFTPGALGPSDSLIFFPLHLPLLNLLHNLLVY